MTTTTETIDVVGRAAEIEVDARARLAAQAQAEAAAQAAAEEAERLAGEAARAQLLATKGVNRPLADVMREVGDQIDALRQAAVDAVLAASGAHDAWLAYRLGAARLLGVWQAFAGQYRNVTGRDAPPGPGYRLPPLPGPAGNPVGEDFDRFVVNVLRKAEPERNRAGQLETQGQFTAPATSGGGRSSG